VRAVRDHLIDGARLSLLTVGPTSSADPAFDGLPARSVKMTTLDVDAAAVLVDPAQGLVTDESGLTDTFTVSLASRPESEVSVPVWVEDTIPIYGIPPAAWISTATGSGTLQFTPATWDVPQEVTVHGIADGVYGGDMPFIVYAGPAVSLDVSYDAIGPVYVTGTNLNTDPEPPPPEPPPP
jgi:hypothetical protein